MTVSANLDNTPDAAKTRTNESMEDASKLPGVLFLLRDTLRLTWNLRVIVYGYTAWLLLPVIIFLFARSVPSPYGNYLMAIENLLSVLLGLWVTAAIVLFTATVIKTHATDQIDYSALGKIAWGKVITLFTIQVFSISLVVFGTILFAIPGIIAWVWTAFAMQEGLLTQKSIGQVFRDSRELTRGRFFPIFGRLLAANALFVGVILMGFAIYILVGLQGSSGTIITTLQAWPSWVEIGLSLISLPLTPISIIFHLLLYFAVKKSYSAVNV